MQALIILALFLVFVVMVYQRKVNTLIGLPILALGIAIAARVPAPAIIHEIVSEGALRLHNPMIVILFGAILSELVKRSGIVEALIKTTAEFFADRVLLVTIALMLLTAVLFSVLSGLGAIVMVGSILLPIMLSVGLSKLTAACVFLLGISIGGTLNLMNWTLYKEVLGLEQSQILQYAVLFLPGFLLLSLVFVFFFVRKDVGSGTSFKQAPKVLLQSPPLRVFLTPFIPVLLVFFFGIRALLAADPSKEFQFPIIAAMMVGIAYALLVAPAAQGTRSQQLGRSIRDGISGVAPALALMVGIGMLLKAVSHPLVKDALQPYLTVLIPASATQYVLYFAAAAPLALYRGPLNIWGMGSGLVVLLKESGGMPGAAIMAALISVGQIQGVSDPTNTYSVWIANYLGIDVNRIMKRTLLWMWIVAMMGLLVGAFLYYRSAT